MNTADYLVKKLEELGINDFFGLPGDYNFNLLYAVENNPNTHWIGCTNELNAGYAADGYARMRGFGAIITTYGVGELSAINAIAGSMAENVPVITIVGIPSTKCIENKACVHHNFQEPNYYAFYEAHKSVTAASAYLTRDNAKIEIDRILKVFVKERKPVYVAIPLDIAELEISDREVNYDWISDADNLEAAAKHIAEKVNKSSSPVILGDVLIKRFDARIEYKEFVEKSGIPTTNFLMGTNLINMDYEKYAGSYFSKYANPVARNLVENTDCLIAVGPIYSDLNSFGFDLPYKIDNHIAIYGTYTCVEGKKYDNVKMSDILEKISELVERREIEFEKPKIGYDIPQASSNDLTSSYIYPRLQEFIKDNDIVIAETGIIPHGVSLMKFPPHTELQTQTLWGSIGWATPAALGVCLAKPNSRVILITGEGSHQLTAMEIGNMLRRNVKPIIIVLNNQGYTVERVLSNSPDDKFNDIMQMNYAKFARVFEGDVWSTKVSTADDFDKALKVTQIMNKLCYIEICTEPMDMPKLTVLKFMNSGVNRGVNDGVNDGVNINSNSNLPIDQHNDGVNQGVNDGVNQGSTSSSSNADEIPNSTDNKTHKGSIPAHYCDSREEVKIDYETVVHKSLEEK